MREKWEKMLVKWDSLWKLKLDYLIYKTTFLNFYIRLQNGTCIKACSSVVDIKAHQIKETTYTNCS